MKELLKQRLVGAVVLIALAVIFIPMIFEAPDERGYLLGDALPTQPDHETPERIRPIELPPVPDPVPEVVQIEESAPPEAITAIDQAPPAPIVQDTEPKPKTAAGHSEKPASDVQGAEKAATPRKAKKADRPMAGWVVQVASVQSKKNALALKDKLRGLGFVSFVEEVKASNGTLYRVRVGPEIERSGAEKQLAALGEKARLKGIILQFP